LSDEAEAEGIGAIDHLYDILEMLEEDMKDLEGARRASKRLLVPGHL
jgi:hypothetical protein